MFKVNLWLAFSVFNAHCFISKMATSENLKLPEKVLGGMNFK